MSKSSYPNLTKALETTRLPSMFQLLQHTKMKGAPTFSPFSETNWGEKPHNPNHMFPNRSCGDWGVFVQIVARQNICCQHGSLHTNTHKYWFYSVIRISTKPSFIILFCLLIQIHFLLKRNRKTYLSLCCSSYGLFSSFSTFTASA